MGKVIHCHICVRGLIRYTKRDLKPFLKSISCDGKPFKDAEALRSAMMDLLAEGVEALPFGEPCEGFDYKKGCPGHAANTVSI